MGEVQAPSDGSVVGEVQAAWEGGAEVEGTVAPHGRRVLVAPVGGELGERIQSFRVRHDAKQANRLPPHLTLCYWPPDEPLDQLEAQVRHAFAQPIEVRLGPVYVLPHREAPLVVRIAETVPLDAARVRLFDRTFVQMGGHQTWPWHITCIRYGHSRDRQALLDAAAHELALDHPWTISLVSYMELQNGRYEPIAEWKLKKAED